MPACGNVRNASSNRALSSSTIGSSWLRSRRSADSGIRFFATRRRLVDSSFSRGLSPSFNSLDSRRMAAMPKCGPIPCASSDREIGELFRDTYDDPLDPTELAELERRTEGWAASLQLVEVSLQREADIRTRGANSSIQSQPRQTATCSNSLLKKSWISKTKARATSLLTTSILHQITPELAERLAGLQDGSEMLAELEGRGLFTYRLDTTEARYRYHGLFREFLVRSLRLDRSDGEVTGLHIHAASYFETATRMARGNSPLSGGRPPAAGRPAHRPVGRECCR